jgi:large subunit ribosomal protein L1
MDLKIIQEKVSELRKNSSKRKFDQTFDIVVTLKDIDLKNQEQKVDFYAHLHHSKGKKNKVCAIVGSELSSKVEGIYDHIILEKDFVDFKKDVKKVKKVSREYDLFIAQANLMPQIAQIFGKYLGPLGKMPNPKAGCVVNIKTDLKTLYANLQKTSRLQNKGQLQVQIPIATEAMDDKLVVDNIHTLYDQLIHNLPKGEHNVKKVLIKLTMSTPIEVPLR